MLKGYVEDDYPGNYLDVEVLAYSLVGNCTSTVAPLSLRVYSPTNAKRSSTTNSGDICIIPEPPPNTTTGYRLVGPNQRCKEAVITNLRRRLTTGTYPTATECTEDASCQFFCVVPYVLSSADWPSHLLSLSLSRMGRL